MAEETPQQRTRRFLFDIGFQAAGTPPRQIRLGDLRSVVARNPDGASNFILLAAGMEDPPSVYRQLALSVALAYRMETGDDTLEMILNNARWSQEIRLPKFFNTDGSEIPIRAADPDPFAPADHSVRGLEVTRSDADAANVEPFVEQFSLDGKAPSRIEQMVSTWGSWIITFPYDDDERPAILIPMVRRYIARVNEAVPYFPSYLDFTPELGMFWLYFGSLADPEAIDENRLDIGHPSIRAAVLQSGRAIRDAATRAHREHAPLWRAMLSGYPPDTIEEFMARLAGGR